MFEASSEVANYATNASQIDCKPAAFCQNCPWVERQERQEERKRQGEMGDDDPTPAESTSSRAQNRADSKGACMHLLSAVLYNSSCEVASALPHVRRVSCGAVGGDRGSAKKYDRLYASGT